MAFYHGKAASFKIGAATVESTLGWTANVTADTAETTAMGDAWKTHETGFIDATVTLEGFARTDRGTVAQVGATAHAVVMYTKTPVTSEFFTLTNVICTSITESVEANDVGKISYTFTSTFTSAFMGYT